MTGPSTRGRSLRLGMPQELRDDGNDDPLEDAGDEERVLIATVAEHRLDDGYEERRAAAETRRHDPGRKTPLLLEPLQRRADRAAVHECRAGAGQRNFVTRSVTPL